jgi:hypothetical protein
MPESFDTLASDLARFQAARVPGYRRLCAAHGVEPASLTSARQAPAVPTDAFKIDHVFAFDASEAVATFRTSGTTLGARGEHRMRDVGTYDAAALAFGRVMIARDLSLPIPVLVLGASPQEASDSSLMHMCATFVRNFGTPEPPEQTFFVRTGRLRVDALRERIARLSTSTPVLVLATSFALVNLLDEIGRDVLRLPLGSRVMQTGGFKGKSREIAPRELREGTARALGVDVHAIVSEYGMTELSSQFWQPVRDAHDTSEGVYAEPPWARIVPVDPETLEPMPTGEVGIARIEDLANVDSAFAILTQDRVRRVAGGGFELLGRLPGAPPRGCSIALEEMWSGEGRQ